MIRTWISDRAEKASVESAYYAKDVVVNKFPIGFIVCTAPWQVLEIDVERLKGRDQRPQNFQGSCNRFNANSVTRNGCNVLRFFLAGHGNGRSEDKGMTVSMQRFSD